MPNNTKTLEYYILNIKCSVRQQANKIPQSYNITIRHVMTLTRAWYTIHTELAIQSPPYPPRNFKCPLFYCLPITKYYDCVNIVTIDKWCGINSIIRNLT